MTCRRSSRRREIWLAVLVAVAGVAVIGGVLGLVWLLAG